MPRKSFTNESTGLYDMGDLMTALQDIPETVVEIDKDGDILLYRAGDYPTADYSGPCPRARAEAIRGICPYRRPNAYYITADRVRTAEEALDWLAHVAAKRWGRGGHLHYLALALGEVLRAGEAGAPRIASSGSPSARPDGAEPPRRYLSVTEDP